MAVKQGQISAVVSEIKAESPKVKRFRLKSKDGTALPKFSGGSHITTSINHNHQLIERHYSLTNDPMKTDYYEIAINRSDQSKGGSVFWHDEVEIGKQLEISYPKNHFPLSFQAKHHIFFAAGIGITPFLAMAAELKRKGKTFKIHYAAPSQATCAYFEFLISNYPDETNFYFSDQQNRMKSEIMKVQPIGTHVYFCGPESMVHQYVEDAKTFGYHDQSIHFELFTPPDFGPTQRFQVILNKSNKVLNVGEDESLLEVLLKNGIQAPYSCKIGGCGSCGLDVLEGKVEHRDVFLTDQEKKENDVMLTCVSRGKNNCIVLDI
ncbi:PDR/VanB family oxidoreductase [Bacillus sp. 1NLA3E]|uniref:PDR/VanB family oxidoreductase n=1 Tax=Bacillus sp. 1NLA3E TaxID=666686 RepID=UPI000247E87F|nr:PDR/VanB family oxidoreductase [Bacillus sp. 1NLA3E]AGK53297.1 vanillate O-demethylase [Bacillus sp. 1NLA3E]